MIFLKNNQTNKESTRLNNKFKYSFKNIDNKIKDKFKILTARNLGAVILFFFLWSSSFAILISKLPIYRTYHV